VSPPRILLFFRSSSVYHRHLHSFPTRRSSDLSEGRVRALPNLHTPIKSRWASTLTSSTGRPRISATTAWPASWYAVASSCGRCRSEEHTSELQSRVDLVCRLLLEKKKTRYDIH